VNCFVIINRRNFWGCSWTWWINWIRLCHFATSASTFQ